MSSPANYDKATNFAYQALKMYNGSYLHINVFQIAAHYPSIKVCSYSDVARRLCISTDDFIENYAESEMGFIFGYKQRHIIFFNDKKCEQNIRFTVAHELGHILLKHIGNDYCREDKEANCFARNLLCPVPLRDELDLMSLSDFCLAFDISKSMARVVIDRNTSDKYYISKENYNTISNNICTQLNNKCKELFNEVCFSGKYQKADIWNIGSCRKGRPTKQSIRYSDVDTDCDECHYSHCRHIYTATDCEHRNANG